ncbi:hypothetical protein PMAYCL1PPCAC_09720 [Pristionchus mayeri]|uniref:lysozyme n=1 Tax=Pristionchus mayeri TaxID=1317129 RepID=A0AAN4ZHI0_9BILA|nr:hypothetical protein PMAYCL1PPCAC_09719 [Pristionchus mayeri]GMR39525.1 hypothetical protein PMAYCL1PPCAC_09720 [Pristionchus mayeri]
MKALFVLLYSLLFDLATPPETREAPVLDARLPTTHTPKDCLQCMCEVESGCTNKPCNSDPPGKSESCGYYQIKLAYYSECGTPGWKKGKETMEVAWKRCAANKNCSMQCVIAYHNRWKHLCPGKSPCEQMSKQHNGGPYGCKRESTEKYWNKIKKACDIKI